MGIAVLLVLLVFLIGVWFLIELRENVARLKESLGVYRNAYIDMENLAYRGELNRDAMAAEIRKIGNRARLELWH
jgi:hypothetical protein